MWVQPTLEGSIRISFDNVRRVNIGVEAKYQGSISGLEFIGSCGSPRCGFSGPWGERSWVTTGEMPFRRPEWSCGWIGRSRGTVRAVILMSV
jgi:hypothetical protein